MTVTRVTVTRVPVPVTCDDGVAAEDPLAVAGRALLRAGAHGRRGARGRRLVRQGEALQGQQEGHHLWHCDIIVTRHDLRTATMRIDLVVNWIALYYNITDSQGWPFEL